MSDNSSRPPADLRDTAVVAISPTPRSPAGAPPSEAQGISSSYPRSPIARPKRFPTDPAAPAHSNASGATATSFAAQRPGSAAKPGAPTISSGGGSFFPSDARLIEQRRRLQQQRQARAANSRLTICAVCVISFLSIMILAMLIVHFVNAEYVEKVDPRHPRPITRLTKHLRSGSEIAAAGGGGGGRKGGDNGGGDSGQSAAIVAAVVGVGSGGAGSGGGGGGGAAHGAVAVGGGLGGGKGGSKAGGSVHSEHEEILHGGALSGARKSKLNLVLEGDGFPENEDYIEDKFGHVAVVAVSRVNTLPWAPLRQLLRSLFWHHVATAAAAAAAAVPASNSIHVDHESGAFLPSSDWIAAATTQLATLIRANLSKSLINVEDDEEIATLLRFDGHPLRDRDGRIVGLKPPQHLRQLDIIITVLSDHVSAAAVEAAAAWLGDTLRKLVALGDTLAAELVGGDDATQQAPTSPPVTSPPFLSLASKTVVHIVRIDGLSTLLGAHSADGHHSLSLAPGLGAMFNAGVEGIPGECSHVLFMTEAQTFAVDPLSTIDSMLGVFAANLHQRPGAVQASLLVQNSACGPASLRPTVANSSINSIREAAAGTRRKPLQVSVAVSADASVQVVSTERAEKAALNDETSPPSASRIQQKAAPQPPLCWFNRTVADKGFHIGLGTERFQPKVFVVRRMMGVFHRDARLREAERIDMAGPYGLLVDLRKFIRVGGFQEYPALIDRVISGAVDMTAIRRSSDIVKFRIFAVERVMEAISLNEVHAAGMELRQLVRTTYAEVVEATAVWEDITQSVFDVQGYDFDGTPLEKREKEETQHFKDLTTVQRLKAAAARLHEAVVNLRSTGKHRDTSTSEEAIGWEMSVRWRNSGIAVFVANVSMILNRQLLPSSFRDFLTTNSMDIVFPSYALNGAFEHEWGPTMKKWFSARSDEQQNPMRVVWDTICCGCCGFSSEIVNFVYPLEKRRVVLLLPSHKQCFCTGYPAAIADTIQRIHISQDQYVLQKTAHDEITVWIAHTDPMSYKTNLQTRRVPDYVIGRSMYEFSRVGVNWVSHMKNADEIWVPAEFVRRLFLDSGVPEEKLVIVPEATDTNYFDPDMHSTMPLPLEGLPKERWLHFCNRDAPTPTAAHPRVYKFFSNFKWEPRKGWEILLEAYNRAFGEGRRSAGGGENGEAEQEPVSLYILSYIFIGPGYQGDIHNTTHIQLNIRQFLHEKLGGIDMSRLPHFCVITETIEEGHMAQLYNSIDAFVLPTRGEGWGLPAIQAMSMGKPTISTNWGGNTEFMKPHNSFLIPLDGIEEVPMDSPYGWEIGKKWATPSMKGTAKLMRFVFENQKFAERIGRRARRYIVQRFSLEAVADLTDGRLREVRKIVIDRRQRSRRGK